MTYLLDTNVWVDFLHQNHPTVTAHLHAADPDDVWLSSIVLAELRYGADKSQRSARNHAVLDRLSEEASLLEFDEAAASAFGRLRAALERHGRPIGPYDMLIAAQALSRDLVLVTDNVDEFGRIQGLRMENWRLD
jgi:tRNA(fMet)-specific endonuclease VapC